MNEQIIREIAAKVNEKVNIPFISEKTEQVFFEFLVKCVLEVVDSLLLTKAGAK